MSFLSRWLRDGGAWRIEAVAPPWGGRPSLHDHVARHLPPDGAPGLLPGGDLLPDEPEPAGSPRFAPGARDGILGHHAAGDAADPLRDVLPPLRRLLRRAGPREAAALYRAVREAHVLRLADALVDAVRVDASLDPDRLRRVARWLAAGAADRAAVQVGIVLLGACGTEEDGPLLRTLARHGEFALYAMVALVATQPSPARELLAVARGTDGWGRVHAVERLAPIADDEAAAWLLREGHRNAVLPEYTALPAARGGRLVEALRIPAPDDALLRGAGEILTTLLQGRGGPGGDIGEYADGAEAAERYLRHLQHHPGDLAHVASAGELRAFVEETEGEAVDPSLGWPARAAAIRALADAFLARPGWPDAVRRGLASADDATFHAAVAAARALGIDAWDAWFARLERSDEGTPWLHAMATDDPARIARVVARAEARLLEADGSPRPTTGWIGPLDAVVGALRDHPGRGGRLVRAALRSEGARDRHMAVQCLAAWPRGAWPDGAADDLRALHARAADDPSLRDCIERCLEGRPLWDLEDGDADGRAG